MAAFAGLLSSLVCLLAVGCGGGAGIASVPDFLASNSFGAANAIEAKIPGASRGLKLIVLPDQTRHPVLEAIQSARTSIDVQMYIMSDDEIVNGLIEASRRKVKVRVLLEPRPFNPSDPAKPLPTNLNAIRAFKGTAVQADWTTPQFVFTHQKSMIVDKEAAWIMTANMSKSARLNNREYIIVDTNRNDISEVQKLFDSDWTNKPYQPGAGADHLVISPENSRRQVLNLINAAQRSLAVGIEVIGDPEVQQALIAKARSRVKVQVLIADPSKYPTSPMPQVAKELQDGGCDVKYLKVPVHHAKVIIADGKAVYTGSVNLTTNSMNNNRELGIIITQSDIVQQIVQVFSQDWAAGGPIGDPAPGGVSAAISYSPRPWISITDN